MAYPYPQFYGGQPWQYQDQLNQLRSAPAPTPEYVTRAEFEQFVRSMTVKEVPENA